MSETQTAHHHHDGPKHPFHLVNPSPWPFLSSIATLVLAFGLVRLMHGQGWEVLLVGGALVIACMFGWWRDVILEAVRDKAHTPVVQHGLRVGMMLFIASEAMFFVAFFWAFFNASLGVSPTVEAWPPEGIETLSPWDLPFLNTLILLSSGLTLNWAHHSLLHNNRRDMIRALALTVFLGVVFLALQMLEYGHTTFGFSDGIYPSVFYMATGFHGFHVFVGVVFLAVNLLRAMRGHFNEKHHVGFEAAAWYWHFVDVVWIFLFIWVYWWGS
ncbi:cytochrome c oxidase subunit 3 [Telmatospirillum sp. J64-1]|uniref:cytochrome c oxidase subunit 3 n=1 Tax=Telmatospirillum sp. J64-1 TaxID=2502183 RepID=UPI00115EA957|nr:cytochrome c oxidase subunit 3 [Telmatospirillum sp. J64-1]